MRVITGIAKGRKLRAPKGMDTRPTTDRVKEALFNLLGDKVYDAVFLDLFAGTGGIGIEALSRGAGRAVFIEKSPAALQVIRENLTITGLTEKAEIYRQDSVIALDMLGKRGVKFDLIYVDPPYLKNYEEKVLIKISDYALLNETGAIVVESSKKDLLPGQVGCLMMVRQEKYGDTLLSFYRHKLANA